MKDQIMFITIKYVHTRFESVWGIELPKNNLCILVVVTKYRLVSMPMKRSLDKNQLKKVTMSHLNVS